MSRSDNDKYLPTAELVLGIINNEPNVADEIIHFYDGYIISLAVRNAYSAEGRQVGLYIDEDLAQEVRLALVESLPRLRQTLKKLLKKKKEAVIVLITDLSNQDNT